MQWPIIDAGVLLSPVLAPGAIEAVWHHLPMCG
jgi:hypothetical protein